MCVFDLYAFLIKKLLNQASIVRQMVKEAKRKSIHVIAATVFAIVVFVHALRLAYGWPFTIANWSAPMWLSRLGVFFAGSLAVLLWQSSK